MKIQRIDKLNNKASIWTLRRFAGMLKVMGLNDHQVKEVIDKIKHNDTYVTNFASYTKIIEEDKLSHKDKVVCRLLKALGWSDPLPAQMKILGYLIKGPADAYNVERYLDSLKTKVTVDIDRTSKKLLPEDLNVLLGNLDVETEKIIRNHISAIEEEKQKLIIEKNTLQKEANLTNSDILSMRGTINFLKNSEDENYKKWASQMEKALKWIEKESKKSLLHKAIQERKQSNS